MVDDACAAWLGKGHPGTSGARRRPAPGVDGAEQGVTMLQFADYAAKPMGTAGVAARLRGLAGAPVQMVTHTWNSGCAIATSNVVTERPTGPPGALAG